MEQQDKLQNEMQEFVTLYNRALYHMFRKEFASAYDLFRGLSRFEQWKTSTTLLKEEFYVNYFKTLTLLANEHEKHQRNDQAQFCYQEIYKTYYQIGIIGTISRLKLLHYLALAHENLGELEDAMKTCEISRHLFSRISLEVINTSLKPFYIENYCSLSNLYYRLEIKDFPKVISTLETTLKLLKNKKDDGDNLHLTIKFMYYLGHYYHKLGGYYHEVENISEQKNNLNKCEIIYKKILTIALTISNHDKLTTSDINVLSAVFEYLHQHYYSNTASENSSDFFKNPINNAKISIYKYYQSCLEGSWDPQQHAIACHLVKRLPIDFSEEFYNLCLLIKKEATSLESKINPSLKNALNSTDFKEIFDEQLNSLGVFIEKEKASLQTMSPPEPLF